MLGKYFFCSRRKLFVLKKQLFCARRKNCLAFVSFAFFQFRKAAAECLKLYWVPSKRECVLRSTACVIENWNHARCLNALCRLFPQLLSLPVEKLFLRSTTTILALFYFIIVIDTYQTKNECTNTYKNISINSKVDWVHNSNNQFRIKEQISLTEFNVLLAEFGYVYH